MSWKLWSFTPSRRFALALLLFGLFAVALPQSLARGERNGAPGDFDYYLLSLSWSPAYCEGARNQGEDPQCDGSRPYAFVLHGLWPQYQKDWPEFCHTPERPWVPQEVIDHMLDIMPSKKLVIHQYRKHGTCSGLTPKAYFDSARRAYDSITIPERFRNLNRELVVTADEVISAFLAANPNLKPGMIDLDCGRNRLREVRICLSKDLHPQSCGANEAGLRRCAGRSLVMPPVRGGALRQGGSI